MGKQTWQRDWRKESVVYQIYPRSFFDASGDGIGDLKGIRQKLDYIKELGADIIWLCPIYKSPNHDNGYDISNYRDIMDEFGTMRDFDELLQDAHSLGIKIMLDLVVNHTSSEHPWFIESKKSKDNPYRDYYIWRDGKNGSPPNNWESFFSGPAWTYDDASKQYYLHLFEKNQPDLNWENPDVRAEIYDMMKWWLDKGVDGFRMDTINMLSKSPGLPDGKPILGTPYGDRNPYMMNGPRIHEFLQEMNCEVLSRYDIISVGETPDVTPDDALLYVSPKRNELNMVFQFDHMGLDYEGLKWCDPVFDLVKLKKILSQWQIGLNGRGWNSLFWNNHDQPRVVSRFGNDGQYRVLSAKMLAVCLYMMQGTPYIYQGEELGMTNADFKSIKQYRDIETHNAYYEFTQNRSVAPEDMMRYLSKVSRDNARTPMQWNSTENAGFTEGVPWISVNSNYREINAEAERLDSDSVFNFYKTIIRLRKENPIIIYGDYELLMPEDKAVFAYLRRLENKTLLVACNFSENEQVLKLPFDLSVGTAGAVGGVAEGAVAEGTARLLISNYQSVESGNVKSSRIKSGAALRPYEAVCWIVEGK